MRSELEMTLAALRMETERLNGLLTEAQSLAVRLKGTGAQEAGVRVVNAICKELKRVRYSEGAAIRRMKKEAL